MKFDFSGMKKVSKHQPLPSRVEGETDIVCPACMGMNLVAVKACCGAPKGTRQCPKCGYKEIL